MAKALARKVPPLSHHVTPSPLRANKGKTTKTDMGAMTTPEARRHMRKRK